MFILHLRISTKFDRSAIAYSTRRFADYCARQASSTVGKSVWLTWYLYWDLAVLLNFSERSNTTEWTSVIVGGHHPIDDVIPDNHRLWHVHAGQPLPVRSEPSHLRWTGTAPGEGHAAFQVDVSARFNCRRWCDASRRCYIHQHNVV